MKLKLLVLFLSFTTIFTSAQDSKKNRTSNIVEKAKCFLPVNELPDASIYLLPPPSTTDARFIPDSCYYEEGKRLRSTQRGKEAIADTSISVDYIMKRFSKVINKNLSERSNPILADLMYRTYVTARSSITKAKDMFKRQRPYQYFKEPTPVPNQEYPNDWTSYPSGHSIRFWVSALLLANIDPTHQDEILKLGYEMGMSRTIVGFHYKSDVDAACMVGGTVYSRISMDKEFQKLFKKAQKEYQKTK